MYIWYLLLGVGFVCSWVEVITLDHMGASVNGVVLFCGSLYEYEVHLRFGNFSMA